MSYEVDKCVFRQWSYWSYIPFSKFLIFLNMPSEALTEHLEHLKALTHEKLRLGDVTDTLQGELWFDWVQSRKCGKVSVTWDVRLEGFTTLHSWQAAKIWADPFEPLVLLIPVGGHRIDKRRHRTPGWLWFASYPGRSTVTGEDSRRLTLTLCQCPTEGLVGRAWPRFSQLPCSASC